LRNISAYINDGGGASASQKEYSLFSMSLIIEHFLTIGFMFGKEGPIYQVT
jgi:hypothetical protein